LGDQSFLWGLSGDGTEIWAPVTAWGGPALTDAGPNARPGRGASLSSDFMTSSSSVNRVTIVVERRYIV